MSHFMKILTTFLISMIPLIELRGAIPYGVLQDLSFWENVVLCIIGNMLPIPFIILFVRKIFDFMKKHGILVKFIEWLENHVQKKSGVVKKYEAIGLAIFVGIPLPGTGTWSGALLAVLMGIRMRQALPAIFLGVVLASFIVAGVLYGFLGFLSFLV